MQFTFAWLMVTAKLFEVSDYVMKMTMEERTLGEEEEEEEEEEQSGRLTGLGILATLLRRSLLNSRHPINAYARLP